MDLKYIDKITNTLKYIIHNLSWIYYKGELVLTYELTVILRISDSVESVKEKVTQILHKHGVSVITEESWDIKKLAYQIENETEGYYLFMTIESPKDAISKITTDFRLIDDILRYLFVKFDKKEDAKSKAEEDSDGK